MKLFHSKIASKSGLVLLTLAGSLWALQAVADTYEGSYKIICPNSIQAGQNGNFPSSINVTFEPVNGSKTVNSSMSYLYAGGNLPVTLNTNTVYLRTHPSASLLKNIYPGIPTVLCIYNNKKVNGTYQWAVVYGYSGNLQVSCDAAQVGYVCKKGVIISK